MGKGRERSRASRGQPPDRKLGVKGLGFQVLREVVAQPRVDYHSRQTEPVHVTDWRKASQMAHYQLQIGQAQQSLEVSRQGDRIHVAGGGLGVDVHIFALRDGAWILDYVDDGGVRRRVRLAGASSGDRRQLWVDGRTLVVERVRAPRAAADIQGSLASTIPAIVAQVLVGVGDEVAAGDKLILLESMKMVIPIHAPQTGRVIKINCVEGDSVAAGVPLVEIETQ